MGNLGTPLNPREVWSRTRRVEENSPGDWAPSSSCGTCRQQNSGGRCHAAGYQPGGHAWIAGARAISGTPVMVGNDQARLDARALPSGVEQWSQELPRTSRQWRRQATRAGWLRGGVAKGVIEAPLFVCPSESRQRLAVGSIGEIGGEHLGLRSQSASGTSGKRR